MRGRLWRTSDPSLARETRDELVHALMEARRNVGTARRTKDSAAETEARTRVDAAKHGLGERGPVWWTDGAPDLNRRGVRTTGYAEWYALICPDDDANP
ncbi:hypothetical protein M0208_06080 [Sphingomonas sp. SUN019]|nr:hypothetical protein M0208_06080 [Sphingomonas sp. SUN019]